MKLLLPIVLSSGLCLSQSPNLDNTIVGAPLRKQEFTLTGPYPGSLYSSVTSKNEFTNEGSWGRSPKIGSTITLRCSYVATHSLELWMFPSNSLAYYTLTPTESSFETFPVAVEGLNYLYNRPAFLYHCKGFLFDMNIPLFWVNYQALNFNPYSLVETRYDQVAIPAITSLVGMAVSFQPILAIHNPGNLSFVDEVICGDETCFVISNE